MMSGASRLRSSASTTCCRSVQPTHLAPRSASSCFSALIFALDSSASACARSAPSSSSSSASGTAPPSCTTMRRTDSVLSAASATSDVGGSESLPPCVSAEAGAEEVRPTESTATAADRCSSKGSAASLSSAVRSLGSSKCGFRSTTGIAKPLPCFQSILMVPNWLTTTVGRDAMRERASVKREPGRAASTIPAKQGRPGALRQHEEHQPRPASVEMTRSPWGRRLGAQRKNA